MTDLVLLSLEPWDEVWRRNQHLVAGLLRADPSIRALFVEPARDPLHDARRRRQPGPGRGLRAGPPLSGVPAGRLWLLEPTKWLPRRIDRRVDDRISARTVSAARHLGFSDPVTWVNDPAGATLLERTGWPAFYDITDDWLAAQRPPREHDRLRRQEVYLLEHCREVVVCSPRLVETKSARARVTLIPNAVDVEPYGAPHRRPEDLPSGPVALYVGTVHRDRMDIDLCVATAEAIDGHGDLVLVGPDLVGAQDRARLLGAGVHLLGSRPFDDVPAYLQHADVLVVPHVVDEFTDSLDPIKVYEYRAARRPVVSTPVAGFREQGGRPGVTIASGPSFAVAVRDALASTSGRLPEPDDVPQWSDRVVQLKQVLDRLLTPED